MFYFFAAMAYIAFLGFFLNSRLKNGYGMVYSAVVTSIFVGLAAYTGGYIG